MLGLLDRMACVSQVRGASCRREDQLAEMQELGLPRLLRQVLEAMHDCASVFARTLELILFQLFFPPFLSSPLAC